MLCRLVRNGEDKEELVRGRILLMIIKEEIAIIRIVRIVLII